MSHALIASILLAVDAYDGHWCTLDWLAHRTRVPTERVRSACVALVTAQWLQSDCIGGELRYGVHVLPLAQALAEGACT